MRISPPFACLLDRTLDGRKGSRNRSRSGAGTHLRALHPEDGLDYLLGVGERGAGRPPVDCLVAEAHEPDVLFEVFVYHRVRVSEAELAPTGNCEKSMITSLRSATASRTLCTVTGAGRGLPSFDICVNDWPLLRKNS